jgi:hypothetical protein
VLHSDKVEVRAASRECPRQVAAQAQLRSSRRGRDGCLDPPEPSQLVRGEGDEYDKADQDANHNGCGLHEAGFVQGQGDPRTPGLCSSPSRLPKTQ